MSSSQADRTIFVTVGTTKFDELIKAVDSLDFADAALSRGYSRLVVQRGAGAYTPHNLVKEGQEEATLLNGLEVKFFAYAPSLRAHMQTAALVISHAGSGSIFEALSHSRPLIVVPNPLLMDNHQAELGSHLAALNHLVCSTPAGLVDALKQLDASKLKPYTSSKTEAAAAAASIVAEIDRLVGFS